MNRPKLRTRVAVTMLGAGLACSAGCGTKTVESPQPSPIETAAVQRGSMQETLRLGATIAPAPEHDLKLATLVAGRVLELKVRLGDSVARGALLARADPAALEQARQAAAAAVATAEREAERRREIARKTGELVERGVAAAQERSADESAADAAQSQLIEARAALAKAEEQLSWSEVRAPFAGVIVKLWRQAGDAVDGTPATPILELAATEPLDAVALVGPNDLARLSPGMTAFALAPNDPQSRTAGTVARRAYAVDRDSGVGEVRVRLTESHPWLLGAACELTIVLGTHDGALNIPRSALRRDPNGAPQALVIADGKNELRNLKVGVVDGERIEILEGLQAGEQVALDPIGLDAGTEREPGE